MLKPECSKESSKGVPGSKESSKKVPGRFGGSPQIPRSSGEFWGIDTNRRFRGVPGDRPFNFGFSKFGGLFG